jgi:hypothetical protein
MGGIQKPASSQRQVSLFDYPDRSRVEGDFREGIVSVSAL